MTLTLIITQESWRLRKPFKISRETATHAGVVHVELSDGEHSGCGEAAGIPYIGETPASIAEQLEAIRPRIEGGLGRRDLDDLLKPGGARNAIDCALWALEARRAGTDIWQLLGRRPEPVTTVYTIGIDTPEGMAADARAHGGYPGLKVKVGIGDPAEQVAAVRQGSPGADIIVDANQAWSFEELRDHAPTLAGLGVKMIEQPLAVGDDAALAGYEGPVPICADESCNTSADLDGLKGRYQLVNIKLDKTGGLTEALKLAKAAKTMGFELMVGNMLGSSLAMAPAFIIAQDCRFVDLDGPLLQAEDRDHAMVYEDGRVSPPSPRLWA